jgi:3-phenylpropionate/cinnamic acid dioxygenase small subunit
MKKNRKKADTYRFNGNPFFHAGSIFSVEMAGLEARVKQFEAKLADPNDPDDKKWTARWLERFRKELEKKRARRSLKQRERRNPRRPKPST